MRVAVIGAGPAGLTAAFQLAKGGVAVDLFESSSHLGGLSRSFDLWGRRVDVGPHRFFSTDARVNRFWLNRVGSDYVMVDRLTRIYYQRHLFHYPLRPRDVFTKLGPIESLRGIASYAKQRLACGSRSQEPSFENWVVRRFGRRLYEQFFKTYSEKLWGIACNELSEDFAAQRIRKLTLREALVHAFRSGASSQHRTLVDCFAYPTQGAGMVYQRLGRELTDLGGRILLNQAIAEILTSEGRVTGLRTRDGTLHAYQHVISTMPLTQMVQGLTDVPEGVLRATHELTFRNTLLVYLEIDTPRLFDDQWLYVHDPDVKIGRVTNFNNWGISPADTSRTILCCESWCNQGDSQWQTPDTNLATQAVDELRKVGLLSRTSVSNSRNSRRQTGDTANLSSQARVLNHHVLRIPRSYPIYRMGYRRHVETIADYLRSLSGLSVIGRYGAFKYNNQDHSILMGLLAAENLLYDRGHDLWKVNSDDDTYQEQALITKSGLVALGEQPAGDVGRAAAFSATASVPWSSAEMVSSSYGE